MFSFLRKLFVRERASETRPASATTESPARRFYPDSGLYPMRRLSFADHRQTLSAPILSDIPAEAGNMGTLRREVFVALRIKDMTAEELSQDLGEQLGVV